MSKSAKQTYHSVVTTADTAFLSIHSMIRSIATVIMLLIIPFSAQPECEQNVDVQALFEHLSGDWQGEAVSTPVGPRPYDISFEKREPFWIYGHADPGAAVHHWGFYCEDDQLWLRFLTTFRGNREPTLLQAITITESEIRFRAEQLDFLEVLVRPGQSHSEFEILHHGKRHVLIELNRDNSR